MFCLIVKFSIVFDFNFRILIKDLFLIISS